MLTILPQDRYRRWLLYLFLGLFGITCINPPYPSDFMLQHVLTVTAIGSFLLLHVRVRFSRLSYTLITLFLCSHLLGARYLYSNVPNDQWSEWLFGTSVSAMFGFERNHYDRLIHFLYGILLVVPTWEIVVHYLKVPRGWSYFVSVQFIVFSSTVYELLEWSIAMLLDPDHAEAYNGQQGDVWDPQRDMLWALAGAVIAMTIAAWCVRRKASKNTD